MIKLTAEELMNTWMVQSMLVTGKKTNNMDMVLKLGQMHLSMKVIINSARNTALEHSSGLMDQRTSVSSIIIIFMVKVFTLGQIIENMKVNGEQIRCMVKVHLLGLMAEDISVNMLTIKNVATVNLFGLMAGVTEVNGSMVSSTVKELMLLARE